jgi:hypothetical protein
MHPRIFVTRRNAGQQDGGRQRFEGGLSAEQEGQERDDSVGGPTAVAIAVAMHQTRHDPELSRNGQLLTPLLRRNGMARRSPTRCPNSEWPMSRKSRQ